MVVLEVFDSVSTTWKEKGRTERIKDNLNPDFVTQLRIDYYFEEKQALRLTVYDCDGSSADLKKFDVLGIGQVTVAELLKSRSGKTLSLLASSGGATGSTMLLRCEEVTDNKDLLVLRLRGQGLDKKDLLGKSDPYYELYRIKEDSSLMKVFTSEVIRNTLEPHWEQKRHFVQQICNNDFDRQIMMKVWDWDKDSAHDLIGECIFTINELISAKGCKLQLINKSKRKPESGIIVVEHASIVRDPTFIDYIKGGCDLSLLVAIDFTGSNGNPRDPGTLHYRSEDTKNPYQEAMSAIGSILAPYDSDGRFVLWGFGGRPSKDDPVSHCFALNFNEGNPEVRSVEEMMEVYKNAFRRVVLSGPTHFHELIEMTCALAGDKLDQEHQHYHILLIITDGVINDPEETINALVEASSLPISVVIAGVGDADFSAMKMFDADEGGLVSSKGVKAERDLVQFVSMNDCGASGTKLAKATLQEIPRQFLKFMTDRKIKPNDPKEPLDVKS